MRRVIEFTGEGLYCRPGDFHIDPSRSVTRALITHAHSDHARPGSLSYLCAAPGAALLAARLGRGASITGIRYGETLTLGDARVSFHPAGHVLGSAQIRIECQGEIWVVSGDYKLEADPTCAPFEPVRCHTFLTESTFGLPLFRWPAATQAVADLQSWWVSNQLAARTSVVFAYALGKTQRLLAHLDAAIGPILVSEPAYRLLPCYEAAGVHLPRVAVASVQNLRTSGGRALVLASPMADPSAWLAELGEASTAFVSGWMLLRRMRRSRGAERGFVLSDHADWDGLIAAIRASGAERVLVTHGYATPLARWLTESGWQAEAIPERRSPEAEPR